MSSVYSPLSKRTNVFFLAFVVFVALNASARVHVSISPQSATVAVNGQQQFMATVSGTTNTAVTWSVDGTVGGSTATGRITTNGLYTAPATTGNHTVTARSVASTDKSASAAVTVTPPTAGVSVDFGSRAPNSRAIPANMISAQLGFQQNSVPLTLLRQANYAEFRIDALLQNVYATPTADWTKLDPTVSVLRSNGFRPLIVMGYTPTWLQISPNPCGGGVSNYHSAPSDINRWAQLAASVVAHMNQAFPGLVFDYEIWNEPDLSQALCVSDGSGTTRLNTYIAMYAAAANAMRAQANADGVQIRIGGPAIVQVGLASTWLPALLNNPNTAPNVDFVSYHHYLAGDSDIRNGMGWDNTSGPKSLSAREQDPSNGVGFWFAKISSLVRAGGQPNATKTPIFVTEYNDDWAFLNDCCRNSPTYSPLFNSLWVADSLNAAYSGANPPGMLMYFSAGTPSGAFCLAGNPNTAMDCAQNGLLPFVGYPQYFAYKLIGGSSYLNLNGGGFMANSVSAPSSLVATAFYTISSDALVLVNPKPTNVNNIQILIQNPGSVSLQGTLNLLNNTNQQITSQSITFTDTGNGLAATINVPAYSVVGISLPSGASATPISVAISPTSVGVNTNQQQQFTATVSGTNNTGVQWWVDGIMGGNASVGTISSTGLYTAPATASSHAVKASSTADITKSATAQVAVIVPGAITVSVSPSSATIAASGTQQFSATVGGTTNTAVTWSVDGIAGGNSTAGTITAGGIYTPGMAGQHTVTATSVADSTKSGSAVVNVTVAIAVHPLRSSLTLTQTQQFTANVVGTGNTAVNWSVDGVASGNPTVGTISSTGLYTPPPAVGSHMITATSVADANQQASVPTVITDFPGVFTYKYDNGRTGQNTTERLIAPSNVNSTNFGLLFSYFIDGLAWAQPLYVANVNLPTLGYRNVLYVATMHDTVYAYDADGKSTTPIWRRNFTNSAAGITTIPGADFAIWYPENGILSTPEIDSSSGTLYCIAATKENGVHVYRLHALDITTGAEKFGGPVQIQATVPGTGWASVGGQITFNPDVEMNRPGLILLNGVVYSAWGSYANDQGLYHGWVIGYNAQTLQQTTAYLTSPNADAAAIWGGGGAIAADSSGNIYAATGNGAFDGSSGGADFGDSLLKLNPLGSTLAVADYFTPFNQASLNTQDLDLNSGGVTVLPDQPGSFPHQVAVAAKDGNMYVLNRDNLGHIHASDNSQATSVFRIGPSWTSASYWNSNVYLATAFHYMNVYPVISGVVSGTATSRSAITFGYPGANPVISANGTSNGIVWAHECTGDNNIAVLHAYDATNLTKELYNSTQAGTRDTIGTGVRFSMPIVANGKVYQATTSRLVVFGMLP